MLLSQQELGDPEARAAEDCDYLAVKALKAQALKEAQWAAAACAAFALWQLFEQRPWLLRLPIDRVGSRLRAVLNPEEGFGVEGWAQLDKEERRQLRAEIDQAIERLADDLVGLPWTSHAQRVAFERPRDIDQMAKELFAKKKPEIWARWESASLARSLGRAGRKASAAEASEQKAAQPALRLVEGGLSKKAEQENSRVVSAKKARVKSAPKAPWLKPEADEADEGKKRREGAGGRARRL